MHTSLHRAADASVGRPFAAIALIVATALCTGGCRTAPTNPFLARHAKPDEEPGQVKTPEMIASELASAARDTSDAVRLAAARTLATANAEGEAVADQTVATAKKLACDTNESVQLQAIESVASWPIEQAGPVLMLVIAEGTPKARRTAAQNLAKRWPPAEKFPTDGSAENQAAALAGLRDLWDQQYAKVNAQAVAVTKQAQQVADDAQQLVDDAKGVAADAKTVANATGQQVNQLVATLKSADVQDAAREQASQALAQLAGSADEAVRIRAAKAMGELGDPQYLPVLLALLDDQPQVQVVAVVSLDQVAGDDSPTHGRKLTQEQQVIAWQQWRKHQAKSGNASQVRTASHSEP